MTVTAALKSRLRDLSAPAGGGLDVGAAALVLAAMERPGAPMEGYVRHLERLAGAVSQKGMTIVPLKLYFHNGYAKLEIGLGKGKGHTDKRRSIADREQKRDIDRAMSKRMKW